MDAAEINQNYLKNLEDEVYFVERALSQCKISALCAAKLELYALLKQLKSLVVDNATFLIFGLEICIFY